MNFVKKLSHCNCDKITGGHQPGWFERLLMKLIPHFDIIKTITPTWEGYKCVPETVLYLRRFYLFRSKWFGLNFGDLYLHHIVRSDDDPDPHDHPWGFTGLILWGGYTDEQYQWIPTEPGVNKAFMVTPQGTLTVTENFRRGWRNGPKNERVRPFTIIRRPAEHIHKVIVPLNKTAWTLILTKGYSRDWNFITKDGPVFWRKYLGIPDEVDYGE